MEIRRGYYFYKQMTRAGQPGMAVASAYALDSEVVLVAFSANGTNNPDSFVLVNYGRRSQKVQVSIKGTDKKSFEAFRTTNQSSFTDRVTNQTFEQEEESYKDLGVFNLSGNILEYESPAGSATTFFAR